MTDPAAIVRPTHALWARQDCPGAGAPDYAAIIRPRQDLWARQDCPGTGAPDPAAIIRPTHDLRARQDCPGAGAPDWRLTAWPGAVPDRRSKRSAARVRCPTTEPSAACAAPRHRPAPHPDGRPVACSRRPRSEARRHRQSRSRGNLALTMARHARGLLLVHATLGDRQLLRKAEGRIPRVAWTIRPAVDQPKVNVRLTGTRCLTRRGAPTPRLTPSRAPLRCGSVRSRRPCPVEPKHGVRHEPDRRPHPQPCQAGGRGPDGPGRTAEPARERSP
jgi:hypothetical protein